MRNLLATDPDADRFGMIERYADGSHRYFNGNEIGLLLLKLRYDNIKEQHKNLYMVKSIVSSAASDRLAHALEIENHTVLTGFKYISEILQKKKILMKH